MVGIVKFSKPIWKMLISYPSFFICSVFKWLWFYILKTTMIFWFSNHEQWQLFSSVHVGPNQQCKTLSLLFFPPLQRCLEAVWSTLKMSLEGVASIVCTISSSQALAIAWLTLPLHRTQCKDDAVQWWTGTHGEVLLGGQV